MTASEPPLVGAALAGEHRERTLDGAELAHRRAAVTALGDQLRRVVAVAALTEVSVAELDQAREIARALADALAREQRAVTTPASVDDFDARVRMYNPVTGLGSAVSPPVVFTTVDGGVVAEATVSGAFEGPFAHVHGGMLAMLMDQIVGQASAVGGHRGMTAHLEMRYRRPTPLDVPLRLSGRLESVDGRKGWTVGTIARADDPDTVLVEGRGLMVIPNDNQVRALFGSRGGELGEGARHD